jgi:transcriptional regulator with XRE-family HTH domain
MAKTFDQLARRTMPAASRARAAHRTREILAELLLAEVRKMAGKSQSDLAEILGIKQPSLSKLESQGDMQISTLQRIIEALGGKVEIVARFPRAAVSLRQFQSSRSKAIGSKKNSRQMVARRSKTVEELQLV